MDHKKERLLKTAAKLYNLGLELEAAREKLRDLVKGGAAYDSEEMAAAYNKICELERQWKSLEQLHLALRDELICERQNWH